MPTPIATRATTFWSTATAKAYVGASDTSQDLLITQIADAVSERFENETNRIFVTRALSEIHDGIGHRSLWLRRYPVQSLVSLAAVQRLGDTPVTYVYQTDYDVNLITGELRMRTQWLPRGWQNVTVTYTAGFGAQDAATLPADLYQAGLDWIKALYSKKTTGAVAATSLTLGNSTMIVREDMPKPMKDLLARWRAPQLVGVTR